MPLLHLHKPITDFFCGSLLSEKQVIHAQCLLRGCLLSSCSRLLMCPRVLAWTWVDSRNGCLLPGDVCHLLIWFCWTNARHFTCISKYWVIDYAGESTSASGGELFMKIHSTHWLFCKWHDLHYFHFWVKYTSKDWCTTLSLFLPHHWPILLCLIEGEYLMAGQPLWPHQRIFPML